MMTYKDLLCLGPWYRLTPAVGFLSKVSFLEETKLLRPLFVSLRLIVALNLRICSVSKLWCHGEYLACTADAKQLFDITGQGAEGHARTQQASNLQEGTHHAARPERDLWGLIMLAAAVKEAFRYRRLFEGIFVPQSLCLVNSEEDSEISQSLSSK